MKQSAARARAHDPADSLTERDRRLVAESLARLTPASGLVAELFRRRAVNMDARLRSVFDGFDLSGVPQWTLMLRAALTTKDTATLFTVARLMGTQARERGLRPEDYVTCAGALFWTLERSLRDDFNAPLRQAWGKFAIELTRLMIGDTVPASARASKKRRSKQHAALDEAAMI